MKKTALYTVTPEERVDLHKIDADDTGEYKQKEEPRERLKVLRARLAELQEALYAENKQSLLVVFQAMDTGGKDGATKQLLTGVDPAGVRITSFKAPSLIELQHDFLWRIHAQTPERGVIGVWNRSHYEDVLIVRVHKLIERKTWLDRYDAINAFEKNLVENGTTIVKFFLHISKEEQKARLQARLDRPEKTWKFNPTDLTERALWSEYQHAYEDALSATSTEYAPWHIVSANKKWARDIAVAEAVVEALEKMNPQFPKPDFDPTTIKID
ncbi:MAG TPA: polyphosphate kinase 2 family protein [Abditibacteriaceae bacterium]|jgi:PPK2 family polyphosphate:nucleotide phosphotransferase